MELTEYLQAEMQVISFLVLVSEFSEEGYDDFSGPQRGGPYLRGFRGGRGPRMGRGGDRWHDNAMRGRPPVPLFGNIPRFGRPGMFEQRFRGRPRFNGVRFDGNRFNGPPRFEGRPRFDASPMFRRGGPRVRLEAPFRGGPAMGPRFPGPVRPLLNEGPPPWYDGGDELENEEEMEDEGFETTDSGPPPPFDHSRPPWTDSNAVENEDSVPEGSLDNSYKAESTAVASVDESVTSAAVAESAAASSDDSTGAEKRARKSRWSSVPPQSAEQPATSAQPPDSSTEATDSTANTEAASDAV